MSLPETIRKINTIKLSHNFREATQIVTGPLPKVGPGAILVKVHYAGVNASDVKNTEGMYRPDIQPPFGVGFEGIGEVAAVGAEDAPFKVGQIVLFRSFFVDRTVGAYADYVPVLYNGAIVLPKSSPEYLPLLVSATTASIAIERAGELKEKETILVTAAAGGTGSFAVQLAKKKGAHVIGTTSSEEKAQYLKSLGVDRVINYTKESLDDVLSKEYPKGVNVVYECVGGETFLTCLKHLAVFGRLIVIGSISEYQDSKEKTLPGWILSLLLKKCASIRGFFLLNYEKDLREHLPRLLGMLEKGELQSKVDSAHFTGLEGVADAVDHLYSKKSMGKVVVDLRSKM